MYSNTINNLSCFQTSYTILGQLGHLLIFNYILQDPLTSSNSKIKGYSTYPVKDYRSGIDALSSPQFYDKIQTSGGKKRHISPESFGTDKYQQSVCTYL